MHSFNFSAYNINVFKQNPNLPLNKQESDGHIIQMGNLPSTGSLGKQAVVQQNTTLRANSFSSAMGTNFTIINTNEIHTTLL